MFVKFCGFTRKEDVEFVKKLPVSAVGFIFYKKSKRYVTPCRALELGNIIEPNSILKIGVFVEESAEDILDIAHKSRLDGVQVYNQDVADELEDKIKVIRCYRVNSLEEFVYPENTKSMVLVDKLSCKGVGGTGESFEWSEHRHSNKIIVAGGLNENSLKILLKKIKPFGIDLSSGIEIEQGIKSKEKMQSIIKVLEEFNVSR